MSSPEQPAKSRLPTVALFVTVLLVSVLLTASTELHGVVRMGIAVASGVLAAALTTAVVSKRR